MIWLPARTRLNSKLQDLVDGLDVLVRRSVGDYQDRANKAHRTAQPADDIKPLAQEVGAEHGAREHAQGPKGRDQHGWGEGVRREVEELAGDLHHHARPPRRVAEVFVSRAFEAVPLARIPQPGLYGHVAGPYRHGRAEGEENPDVATV